MRTPPVLPCLVLLALSTATLATRPAAAQSRGADAAAAEALYTQGRKLLASGETAAACAKLEESQRLDPGMGTEFYLAECYEKLGRTASAWAAFREVQASARTAGRRDRESLATRRVDDLEPRLVRLQVDVPWGDRVPGVEVRRDDVLVGHGQWGMPVPVDPGAYTLRVTAPNRAPASIQVEVRAEGQTRHVTIPELADAHVAGSGADGGGGGEGGSRSTLRTAGWVMVGTGAAALVAGGALGLVAKSDYSGSKGSCGAGGTCTNMSDINGQKSAASMATAATVVFLAGAAIAAAGVTLELLPRGRTTALRVEPSVGASFAGLAAAGAF